MEFPFSLPALRTILAVSCLAILLGWETARPYFALFGSRGASGKSRWRHAASNLALGLLNAVLVALLFSGLWLWTTQWASAHHFGLLHRFDLPAWGKAAIAILLLDVWMYAWHRLNHRLPFFWRFHRLHHADRAMDVTTASRFHTGEIVFSSILRVPVLLMIGCTIGELALYEILLFLVVQFHHANIALPDRLDRCLRLFIVTPSLHKVHHSVLRVEHDSNYSSLFCWWDMIFRTRRLLPDPHRIVFGVED